MTGRQLWRVRVFRGDHIVETRVAVEGLAEQYANVMRLRFPGHRVTCDPVSDLDAAYSDDPPA